MRLSPTGLTTHLLTPTTEASSTADTILNVTGVTKRSSHIGDNHQPCDRCKCFINNRTQRALTDAACTRSSDTGNDSRSGCHRISFRDFICRRTRTSRVYSLDTLRHHRGDYHPTCRLSESERLPRSMVDTGRLVVRCDSISWGDRHIHRCRARSWLLHPVRSHPIFCPLAPLSHIAPEHFGLYQRSRHTYPPQRIHLDWASVVRTLR